MWRGAPASLLLHAAVVFGGTVAWPYLSPPRTAEMVIVPIELVSVAPTTNIAPSVKREEPEEPDEEAEEPPLTEEDIPPEEDSIPDEERQ